MLSEYERALYTGAQRKLHEVMQHSALEETEPRAIVKVGETADEILDIAGEQDADLIVIGSHGLKGRPEIFGSVTDRVACLTKCPLLIVPACTRAH